MTKPWDLLKKTDFFIKNIFELRKIQDRDEPQGTEVKHSKNTAPVTNSNSPSEWKYFRFLTKHFI